LKINSWQSYRPIVLRLAIHIPVISDWERMSCSRERPNPPI